MKRDVDLRDISDGKLYTAQDLVRADTNGCAGCSRCCREMCETIVLDPMDIYRLQLKTGMSFEQLMNGYVQLRVVDGLILPRLEESAKTGACVFLNEQDRCSIHDSRPGFCRLFPLGRVYQEDGSFRYFLQIHECDRPRSKVKVRKWLEIADLDRYEAYIRQWHSFWLEAQKRAEAGDEARKEISMLILRLFFLTPWDPAAPFYPQFEKRLEMAAGSGANK